MLELKEVCKTYGQEKVLENLSISIRDGEFLVLVGPSGSGKSTIIRLIAGLEPLDSGTIIFNGQNIERLAPKDRSLSMVFQNYALYPHKTVFENIAFPLQMNKEPKESTVEKVQAIAQKLDIKQYLNRKPNALSGGQRQRVALARAMVKQPKIFLMDEPLSNLDAKLRAQMRIEIHKLHKDSKSTFIYVTHDQTEALSLGERIAVLSAGKIQQLGTPYEIYNHPKNAFVAGFIGSPPTNLLKPDLLKLDIVGEKDFKGKIIGIRPEYLKLDKESEDDETLDIQIQNIELLGREFFVYGYTVPTDDSNSQLLIARIPFDEKSQKIYEIYSRTTDQQNTLKLYYSKNNIYCLASEPE